MRRRHLLQLLAAGLAALPRGRAAAQGVPERRAVPRVNGGINVQPLRRLEPTPEASPPLIEPALVDLQMRAVYALGFQQLRITLSFNRFGPDFFAAIPYVRCARALGIDVVGVLGDFAGYSLVQALAQQRSAAAVLNTYRDIFVLPTPEPAGPAVARTGAFALQVLNEPIHFLGLSAEDYVQGFLRPINAFFKLRSPELVIVSAAEIGNIEGIFRQRALLEAGLEAHCDRVAYHVYSRSLPPLLAGLVERPVWITESGAEGTPNHLPWLRDVFPEMRDRIGGVERIFFYVLFDRDPGRFRLLDIARSASGEYQARAESQALADHLAAQVSATARDQPTTSYDELVPDITAYFPTPFDFDRAVEASPFLPPP